jgi:hypothetical protein
MSARAVIELTKNDDGIGCWVTVQGRWLDGSLRGGGEEGEKIIENGEGSFLVIDSCCDFGARMGCTLGRRHRLVTWLEYHGQGSG